MNTERREYDRVSEFIDNHPRLMEIAASAVLFWSEHLVATKEKGKEYLLAAVDHINRGRGGLLVFSNHISMLDAVEMLRLRKLIDRSKRMTVFWANKFRGKGEGIYTGENQEKYDLVGKIGEVASKQAAIDLVPIPQEAKDKAALYEADRVITETRDLTLGNNNALGFYIEGTRSRTGNLVEAKQGAVNRLFRNQPGIQEHTLILPIAIQGSDEVLSTRDAFNPFKAIEIRYGQPFKYADAAKDMEQYHLNLADAMMLRVARMLPREKWGVYTDSFSQIIPHPQGD